jgi:hypothetical protein
MQIAKWRKAAIEQLPELFADGRTRKTGNGETDNDALYQEIGRLKGRAGLAQEKSRHARLTACACWWIGSMRSSVFGGSANCRA